MISLNEQQYYIKLFIIIGKCISILQSNDVSSLWFLYYDVVTLIFKQVLPNPIGTVCVLITLWRILSAHSARRALIHKQTVIKNNSSGGRRSGTGANAVSKNTQAMILLCFFYFYLSLPNIFLYIIISMQGISCTFAFWALLASDIFQPVSCFAFFTRICDGLVFLVVPEFRGALNNILHCKFHTKIV